MKTRYYKTIRGLMRANGLYQFSLYDLAKGRICGVNGWINFRLSSEKKEAFYRGIAGVVWSKVTPERVRRVKECDAVKYPSTTQRLTYDESRGFGYCAGQDEPAEIRRIQRRVM